MIIDVNADAVYESINAGDYCTSRATYKAIKNMDHKTLDKFLARVCLNGYRDGVAEAEKALTERYGDEEEVRIEFDEVLKVIGQVKDIKPSQLTEIEKRCMEVFG